MRTIWSDPIFPKRSIDSFETLPQFPLLLSVFCSPHLESALPVPHPGLTQLWLMTVLNMKFHQMRENSNASIQMIILQCTASILYTVSFILRFFFQQKLFFVRHQFTTGDSRYLTSSLLARKVPGCVNSVRTLRSARVVGPFKPLTLGRFPLLVGCGPYELSGGKLQHWTEWAINFVRYELPTKFMSSRQVVQAFDPESLLTSTFEPGSVMEEPSSAM